MTATLLSHTESVCPVCLQRLPAQRVAEDDNVYLIKTCPEHGNFRTVVWRGVDSYAAWGAAQHPAAPPPTCETENLRGCPFDCGLCPEHRQHSCCVLVDVTARCNLRCPVCFASAGAPSEDPSLADIRHWLSALHAHSPQVNIQLSGGEPTVRDDLAEIVAMTREIGFDFVQVNTNGIRLARDAGYARRLAGPDSIAYSCSSTVWTARPARPFAASIWSTSSAPPSNTAARPGLAWSWCRRWCQASTWTKSAP